VSLILAIDPGLATLGISLFDVELRKAYTLALFESSKASKKANLLAADDTAERARELHKFLVDYYQRTTVMNGPPLRAIFAEAQSWPRNAGAAAKIGVAWGVLVAFANHLDLPILQLSPQKVRKHLHGSISASKGEIQGIVQAKAEFSGIAQDQLNKIAPSKREHIYDALAVGLCAGIHPGWSLVKGGR
jgi:Holliday junction resolvasome RuvABC endonuclease subunit